MFCCRDDPSDLVKTCKQTSFGRICNFTSRYGRDSEVSSSFYYSLSTKAGTEDSEMLQSVRLFIWKFKSDRNHGWKEREEITKLWFGSKCNNLQCISTSWPLRLYVHFPSYFRNLVGPVLGKYKRLAAKPRLNVSFCAGSTVWNEKKFASRTLNVSLPTHRVSKCT